MHWMVSKTRKRKSVLQLAISRLYDVFSVYSIERLNMCPACYTDENAIYLASTPVTKIETKMAVTLLCETADHGESVRAYKHFLPRILEVLSPPESEKDQFPLHLFEVLEEMRFGSWPIDEKAALIAYLQVLTPYLDLTDAEDACEWAAGMNQLMSGESSWES